MNWVPRWFEAYYNTDSVLRKLYFLGIYYYPGIMKQVVKTNFSAKFYGEVGQDRYTFIAQYHYPNTYIPNITLHLSGSAASSIVAPRESLGSMLYEWTTPVYFKADDILHFKNLDVRSVAVTATSGIINLTTAFSQYALDVDSPIIVKNYWGDCLYFDQSNINLSLASGTIFVPYEGSYTVYYRSSTINNSLVAGTSYIKIDGETIPIKLQYLENAWDNLGQSMLLKRNKHESNTAYKVRIQHYSVANYPNQKIAAALGKTVGITWYTSGGTFSTSGYNDWVFQDYYRALQLTEYLTKVGSSFMFTFIPSGTVHLLLKGNKVDESSYTVSGSYLVCNSDLLRSASEGELTASYTSRRMPTRNYPETANLEAAIPDGRLYRGILVKDEILVKNVAKKIKEKEWKWNANLGLLNGLADFDF
jgi:hypothetical protein